MKIHYNLFLIFIPENIFELNYVIYNYTIVFYKQPHFLVSTAVAYFFVRKISILQMLSGLINF